MLHVIRYMFSTPNHHNSFVLQGLPTIRPTLKDLLNFVAPRIAAVWYNVGLRLDLEPHVFNNIETENTDRPRKMFKKWLQRSDCSWQRILDAVKETCGAKPLEDI